MARCLCWMVLVSAACVCAWAQSAPPSAAPADCRIWFEPGVGDGTGRASILLDCTASQPADTPVNVKGTIRAERPLGAVTLRFDVLGTGGGVVFHNMVATTLDREEGPFHFDWDARSLPAGTYSARFELLRPPGISVVTREYTMRKASLGELQARLDDAGKLVADSRERLTAIAGATSNAPYLAMRLAIAADYLSEARDAVAAGNLPRADDVIRYIEKTVKTAQAEFVFGKSAPEFWDAAVKVAPESIEAHDGAFTADGRPVFLVGAYLGETPQAAEVARIASYGLNLATFSCGPNQTLESATGDAGFRAALDPVFGAALENRVGLMASLDPHAMPAWAVAQTPEIGTPGAVDITQPAACKLIERHVKTLVPYLAQEKALCGLAVMENPSFKFTGEEIRQRFLAEVKERYKDRHALNKAWKGLFADMDTLEIGWNHVSPRYQDSSAYRYDWQTFHQRLGSEYIGWLTKLTRESCDKPLMVAFSDNAFASGEAETGIDRETLASQFDIGGACASNTHTSPYYAIEYPKSLLTYTLMRSLAPDKPVVNFDGILTDEQASENPSSFEYIHTAVWEAAMNGVNGLALRADPATLRPECLEGYATACLDLNRLAPLVDAFQKAPAEVAIFWSMPSKIYNNGSPHLDSAAYAYEGCSFSGYKVRFITEKQCIDSKLADVKVLVVPDSPAVSDDAFHVLKDYMSGEGTVVRTSFSILYDQFGHSRRDIIGITRHTVLVRGQNLPTEYLHAVDAVTTFDELPRIPHTINASGYLLEGVKSRFLVQDGEEYLYVVNLRKERTQVNLSTGPRTGRDLIHGCEVAFPARMEPLVPMLVRLDKQPEKPKENPKS